MRTFGTFKFVILFDDAGNGSGTPAGTPAAPASGTPSSPAASPGSSGTPAATPATGTPGAPASTARPAGQPTPGATGDPDPNRFIPRTRYNESQSQLREAQATAARLQKMIEAGTGIKVPGYEAPQDPNVVEARKFLLDTLVPELKPLLELKPDELKKAIEYAQQFPQFQQRYASSEQAHWNGRGEQALDYISTNLAKDLGVEQLTPFQSLTVGQTFTAWLQMEQSRLAQYSRGDSKLYDDFLTEYRSGFFDPLRRVGQAPGATVAARVAALPSAPRRSGAIVTPPTAAVAKTEDEVHDAAWKNFAAQNAGSR